MDGVYLITYKKRKEKDTSLAEMSGMLKLLNWIAQNANQCDTVLIQRENSMGLFNRKKDEAVKVINCQPVVKVITEPDSHRPCLVGDRRAIFHRWVNSANPVLPRGVEVTENSRYYQFRRTEALVEYEDGTVARVYPSDIRFVDGGDFDTWDWEVSENKF